MNEAINHHEKQTRISAIEIVKKEAAEKLVAEFPDNSKDIAGLVGEVEYHALHSQVLDPNKRVDGRGTKEVRPITIDSQVLPRAHGSALFTRGQTQALVAVTLGTANDVQRLDSIDEAGETTKSFMLHYNFPPFSTGEVRPMRGTSRREIGHGNLAERALQGVLDRKSTRLNSSHTVISYAVHRDLHSFPTRRSSDLRCDVGHGQRRPASRQHRRSGRDDEVVHAPLQLPAILHW